MRLLVLGGTVFLGRHLVEVARERGHPVTLLNRGESGPDVFADDDHRDLDQRRGDRTQGEAGLAALGDDRWDAVVDTCGYLPGVVATSARILAGRAKAYCFVSSLSALAVASAHRQDESAPVAELPAGADDTTVTGETYGALKVRCERAVSEHFEGRVLLVRPGLIVGPHDPSDRFTYWPRRISQGGSILAPPPEARIQFIDVRDLADWIVRALEARLDGLVHVTGPRRPMTMGQFIGACDEICGSDAVFTWVTDAFLEREGVAPFTELPLWIPAESGGFLDVDINHALTCGLSMRPLGQTVADTLAWDATRGDDDPVTAGLPLEREQQLLAKWAAEQDGPSEPGGD